MWVFSAHSFQLRDHDPVGAARERGLPLLVVEVAAAAIDGAAGSADEARLVVARDHGGGGDTLSTVGRPEQVPGALGGGQPPQGRARHRSRTACRHRSIRRRRPRARRATSSRPSPAGCARTRAAWRARRATCPGRRSPTRRPRSPAGRRPSGTRDARRTSRSRRRSSGPAPARPASTPRCAPRWRRASRSARWRGCPPAAPRPGRIGAAGDSTRRRPRCPGTTRSRRRCPSPRPRGSRARHRRVHRSSRGAAAGRGAAGWPTPRDPTRGSSAPAPGARAAVPSRAVRPSVGAPCSCRAPGRSAPRTRSLATAALRR